MRKNKVGGGDEHPIREIKRLKFDEPHWFKRKANKDQFKFNVTLQDVVEKVKLSMPTNCLEKMNTRWKEINIQIGQFYFAHLTLQ